MKNKVIFDAYTNLFTIDSNKSYSCLGLDICKTRATKLAAELNEKIALDTLQPLALYSEYKRLVKIARIKHKQTGWRSQSQLTPELIGFEGKRVEVIHRWPKSGEVQKSRFIVGKSMGWIPCHLTIKKSNSIGGEAVCFGQIQSVRVVD
jgi:hypothetical protein